MKQQRGFTLVELIIVIVILGILAVTAAPRFFDFSGDARASTIEGLKAAVQGGSEIGYARNALTGSAAYPVGIDLLEEVNLSSIEADGSNEVGGFEWVHAVLEETVNSIANVDVLYITLGGKFASDDAPEAADVKATDCYISYAANYDPADEDNNIEPPVILTVTTGC